MTIVSLRALGLGDLLAGVPALRAIRRAFPGERHVLAAPAVLEPLALLSGTVDAVVDTAPLAPLAAELEGAALLVNLHGRGPQSTAVARAAGPERLIAFDIGADGPRWRDDEHERSRWCRLLRESGIPADPGDLRLRAPARVPAPAAMGATLIHPGAASAARRWPADRFAAVARREVERGQAVVVTGSSKETQLAHTVASLAGVPASAVLAGTTNLLDLAAAIAAADRVVCGDTGVAHLAVALGTPSVQLFGPTSPRAWGPPADDPCHRVLWHGRHGNPHAATPDAGLLAIGAEEVAAALASRGLRSHAAGTGA